MIYEFISMNGYGLYVWSSFIFTLVCFISLYTVIKLQLVKEQKKFKTKYFDLTKDVSETVRKQETYKEILAFTNISKI
tara:strand:- start:809 stop:1042 length:234 start_codon:yes stop_codon:yes gene_type:complete